MKQMSAVYPQFKNNQDQGLTQMPKFNNLILKPPELDECGKSLNP